MFQIKYHGGNESEWVDFNATGEDEVTWRPRRKKKGEKDPVDFPMEPVPVVAVAPAPAPAAAPAADQVVPTKEQVQQAHQQHRHPRQHSQHLHQSLHQHL